ncbi:unnamed protein product [Discosporangium mesarthrocarpum]
MPTLIERLATSSTLIKPTAEEITWFVTMRNRTLRRARPKHQPVQGDSKPRRRASLVILLRGTETEKEEILLIRRARNPRDPWSGHVALPGGRQDIGETDLETAVRECKEEVGIQLCSRRFALLGRLSDRRTSGSSRALTVSCFVFVCLECNPEVELKLQASEVAHAWWVDTSLFFPRHKALQISFPVTTLKPSWRKKHWEVVLWCLRLENVHFPCFYLPPPPGAPAFLSSHSQQGIALAGEGPGFVLWGLTFWIVSDLVVSGGGRPFARSPPSFKFRNPVVDYSMHMYYNGQGIVISLARKVWSNAVQLLTRSQSEDTHTAARQNKDGPHLKT